MSLDSKKFIHKFSIESFVESKDDAVAASVATAWALCLSCFYGDQKVSFRYHGRQLVLSLKGKTVQTVIREILDFESFASPGSVEGNRSLVDVPGNLAFSSAVYAATDVAQGDEDVDAKVVDIAITIFPRSDGGVDIQAALSSTLAPEVIMKVPYHLQTAIKQIGHCTDEEILLLAHRLAVDEECAPERRGSGSGDQLVTHSYLVHQLFEKQVLATPHNPAIQFEDEEPVVYEDLNGMANRVARHILRIFPNESGNENGIIALCLEKGVSMIIAILAVLKAGKAWVPLDPKNPRSRLDKILQATQAPITIVTRSTAHMFSGSPVLVLEEIGQDLQRLSPANLDLPIKQADLCHVLFTSGSTGVPKGVMIEHAAMVNNVCWLTTYCDFNECTRTLQFASYTFDVCGLDIFMTLARGGCLFVAPTINLLADLNGFIESRKVNYAQLTPTVIDLLDPSAVPSLKTLVSSGEVITENILRTWLGRVRLINAYGPTETNLCTLYDVSGHQAPNCIGGPDWGMGILILDEDGRKVSIGAVGEICVTGPQLFRGYLGDPETTLKKRITYAGRPLYRTGDLGSFDSDGRVYYHGRQDNQVKLLGNRVDLEEVEICIAACRSVRNPVAIVPRSGPAKGRLAAIMSLAESSAALWEDEIHWLDPKFATGAPQVLSDLKDRLLSELPPHMIPNVWFTLKNVPLTASGKVNRTAVRNWVEMLDEQQYQKYVQVIGESNTTNESLTPTEKQLREIWSRLLSLPPHLIPVESSFFDLGGDSISVIRMVSDARNAGLMISVQDVFTFKSNRRISLAAEEQKLMGGSVTGELPLTPFCILPKGTSPEVITNLVATQCNVDLQAVVDIYPCSPLQEGLMASSATNGAYVSRMVFKLPGIDSNRFKTAWEEIVKNEGILRTRIVEMSPHGTLQAIINSPVKWESAGSSVERYLQLRESGRGMSYGDKLCRFALIFDNGWHFVLTLHHAIFDGWSLSILKAKLRIAYELGATPPQSHPFNSFIKHVTGHERAGVKEFWATALEGACITDYPILPSPQYGVRATSSRTISTDINFRHVLKSQGVTVSAVVRAAWAIVLARHSNSDDVCFGVTMSGRNVPLEGIEEIVGPTLVTVPVRIKVQNTRALGELLGCVQKQAVDMIPFEHTGLQNIKEISVSAKNACSFRTLLIVQPEEDSVETEFMQNLSHLDSMQRSYPLTVECRLGKGEVNLDAHFDDMVINQRDVDWILVHLRETLHAFASDDCTKTICEMRVLGSEDVQQIFEWNKTCPQKVDRCLHHLFEQEAAENPLRIAIYDQTSGSGMSYADLNSISTHLAHKLQELRVTPETLVPVCFEQSTIAIVAIIAVLKAGAAYVPLDVCYPDSRLELLIKETGAMFVLCSPSCAQRLHGSVTQVVVVDASSIMDFTVSPTPHLVCEVQPDNAAFVTYTSGSTGVPKAVVLTHSAIGSSVIHLGKFYQIQRDMRVLQFNSFTFDMSLKEIFITLIHGGCICIPTEYNRLNNMSQAAGDMAIDVAFLTPTIASLIHPAECPSLKILCTGGEMLTRDIINTWAEKVSVFNSYGPTESCMNVSATVVPFTHTTDLGNIGRGVAGNVWIVTPDEPRRLMPVGCPGEIVLSGHTLARGYLNDTEKTDAAFIATPIWMAEFLDLGCETPARCYLTGDTGCYNYDGSIQYLGRLDRQVNVNGLRIELGDIEHRIRSQNSYVHQAVVELITIGQQNGPSLVVFVEYEVSFIPESEKSMPLILSPTDQLHKLAADAKNRLRGVLPPYMIPTYFVPVSRIPKTTSGKIDRRKLIKVATNLTLQEIEVSDHQSPRAPSGSLPQSEAENLMCNLWKEVLKIGEEYPLTVSDNFFHLGGDSIATIRLVAAARRSGLSLPGGQIYKKPQLGEMASSLRYSTGLEVPGIAPFALARQIELDEIASLCQIPSEDIEDIYPCTPLQEGLMAISTRSGAYIAQRVYKFSDFEGSRFCAAWEDCISSSPILRTRMIHVADGSFQVVCKEFPGDLWRTGENLEQYLGRDREDLIKLGDRLCRFALVRESGSVVYFVLTMHHAIYDGWSMELLMNDFGSKYAHLRSQRTPRPDFNIFINFLENLNHESSAEYWGNYLEGAVPSDFPPTVGSKSHTQTSSIEGIDAVVEHQSLLGSNINFATAVRAAWAFVLSRYMDSSDVCFGMTLSGRDTDIPGVERIVGPTAVTIPVRVKFDEKESIEHFLQRIQQQAIDMTPFQHAGLQNIQRISTETRNACSFRNILVIHNNLSSPSTLADDPEMPIIPIKTMTNMLQAFFTMECQLTKTGVSLTASYDNSSIGKEQVQRLLRHFVNAIRQMISLSSGAHILGSIIMVTEEDFEEIQAWNSNCPTPIENCVHHLFEAEAKLHPDSLAIDTTGSEKFTYGQVENYATRLAHHITSIGIGHGCLIPICFRKSSIMVVVMLAVMKAGAGYVPIDPSAPKKRIEYLLHETQANLVIADRTKTDLFDGSITIVSVDMPFLNQLPQVSVDTLFPAGRPSDVAYTIFTSGSTGKPKGVVLEHGTLCTSLLEQGKAFGCKKDTRVLQFCSYTFDISVMEIFGTLLHGGCICMPTENERLVELAKAIKLMAVELAFLTPTFANLLDPDISSLQKLALVGEAHSRTHIDKWASRLRLINAYGPTEASVISGFHLITPESNINNIGRAIGGRMWVTEPNNNNLAAIGTIGELAISGNNLARGYLNDAKRTESVFLKHLPLMPWEDRSGSPRAMYKTGDSVRYNSDGTIQYLGRRDTQIKIHGQRIECGEVEYSITALDQVEDAAVELVEVNGVATLVAFICLIPSISLGIDDGNGRILPTESIASLSQNLKNALADTLPRYMIPSIFVPHVRFPTTVSGKVDRGQMKSIDLSSYIGLQSGPRRQPTTRKESIMRDIWSSTLEISAESIGLDDNFFQLGGDSISAIMIVTSARKLGFALDIAQLFGRGRLEEMASLLVTAETEQLARPFSLAHKMTPDECINIAASLCNLGPTTIEDVYPCSPLQEGLMALSIRSPGAYVTQQVYRLPDGTDIKRVQEAWELTVAANPILRTRIIHTEAYGSMQVVVNIGVEWTPDLRTASNLECTAMGYGAQLCRQALVFDSRGAFLVFTLHHCVYDGLSWELILDDLKEAYESGSLTTSRTPFTSFIKHIEKVQTDPSTKNFWRQNLAGANAVRFPLGNAVVDRQAVFTAGKIFHLDAEVEFFWAPESITIATLLRASWAFLISRYTNSDDVIFGETLSGRVAPIGGIESVTGPTIVTIPTRIRINDEMTVSQYLVNAHTASVERMPFEHLGLQSIRRISDDAQEACNFQSLLVIQPLKRTPNHAIIRKSLGLKLGLENSSMIETYCLSVECQQTSRGVSLSAGYDHNAIDPEKVRWILYHFSQSIKQLAAGYHNNTKQIGEIDFFGEQDLHQAELFNKIHHSRIDRCLHHAFNDRVLLHPGRVAIHASDAILSYGELDALSSSLASELITAGVGPDVLVPLYFKKSSIMVVAMMAVLKAGGGYVPLDTSHPKQRLQYIITEIDTNILLCSHGNETFCNSLGAPVVISIDSLALKSSQKSNGISNIMVTPSNIAYVMFTSGSTGQPKGVVMEHSAVTTSLMAHGPRHGFKDDLRVLQFSTYTFDTSVMEIFSTLLFGGCVCIPSEEDRLVALPQIINQMQIQMAILTPTTVSALLSPELIPDLSTLILIGEPMTQQNVITWSQKVLLINDYGPTETCTDSASSHVTGPGFHPSNIGTGVAAHLWITDPENTDRLTPIGCVGELLISGPTLARGYLNDTEKTNAAFINGGDLSWGKDVLGDGVRLYKTGDLVKYNIDGSIVYVGRKDTQVKLRGLRIEVSEIEHHLSLCPEIQNVAVVSTTSLAHLAEARLIAFVCFDKAPPQQGDFVLKLNETIKATLTEAAARLSDVLPSYMIPSIFLPLKRIPLTVSGKTDRKELQRLLSQLTTQDLSEYRSGEAYKRQPATTTERRMQTLWANILQLQPTSIGLDDNFFRLGGDSMSAIKLATMVHSEGFDFTVQFVFKNPRLADMANKLEKDRNPGEAAFTTETEVLDNATRDLAASACGISTTEVEDIYPCSPLQEGLMALSVRFPGAYVARRVYELGADIDLERFCSAWKTIAGNHPTLRTRIIRMGEIGPVSLQIVCKALPELDIHKGTSLKEYIEVDHRKLFGYGRPLIHCGLIFDGDVGDRGNIPVYFTLTLHHALYDGFSLGLILDDFRSVYSNLEAPYTARTPFKNYIRYLGTLDNNESQEFWKSKLARLSVSNFPSLPSPRYTPRPSASCQLNLDLPAVQKKVTLSAIIRAAWAVTVSRHTILTTSETHDVCFGMTLSGRNAPIGGLDTMTGPTIVTVPVRVTIDYNQPITEFLDSVHLQAADMMPFEYFGLQNIRRLSPDAERACDFKNLLVIHPPISRQSNLVENSFMTQLAEYTEMLQTYGVIMECRITEGGICLDAQFDPLAIGHQQTLWVLQHFSNTIKAFTQNPSSKSPLRDALGGMATKSEYEQILNWNSGYQASKNQTLSQLVESTVSLHPDRPAVCTFDYRLTYKELDLQASILAQHLISLGIGPETLVPICFEKSSAMIVAILGVLKAGGGYVPLDPAHPRARLEYIIYQTEAQIILSSPAQSHIFDHLSRVETLVIDATFFENERNANKSDVIGPQAGSKNVAYVIYTSGSSGNPKGVIIEHGAISKSVIQHGNRFGHDAIDGVRILQFCSYTFDVSVIDIFTTLVYGGCICIPSEDDRLYNLPRVINEMKIDLVILTPTVAKLLDPGSVPGLKVLAMTGEVLTPELVKRWTQGSRRLVNGYGPTEASVDCAAALMSSDTPPNNIGHSLGGLIWITEVEDHNLLTPLGCVGEIVIMGDILARGYLKDSSRTAAAFINNPAWMPQGCGPSRIYKTGDLGRYSGDGSVEYLGRKDTQVKLHGIRIEAGEVESLLGKCGEILQSVVELVTRNGVDMLVGFLHLKSPVTNSQPCPVEYLLSLTNHICGVLNNAERTIKNILPLYMVPSVLIPLSSVPCTTSGKTDRRKLKELFQSLSENTLSVYRGRYGYATIREPETTTQKLVRDIWSNTLQVKADTIGLDDNFFQIGGDSISAIQLVSAFREKGFVVAVTDIHQYKDLEDMAMQLDTSNRLPPFLETEIPIFSLLKVKSPSSITALVCEVSAQCQVQSESVQDIYPCSPLQEGLVALSTRETGAYLSQMVYRLSPTTDLDQFRTAWENVLACNEILRTRIVHTATHGTLQVILKPHVEWESGSNLQQYLETQSSQRLGYGDPLCRYATFTEDTGELSFSLSIHHALYDGWSLPLILEDLRVSYEKRAPPPPHTPYNRFISFITKSHSEPEAASAFWQNRLAGAVVTDFPEKIPFHKINASAIDHTTITLERRNLPDTVTIASLIKAAWAITLARYTNTNDVCFGMALAGRNSPVLGIESISGPTLTAVPVRIILNPTESIAMFLKDVHSQSVDMIPYEHVGLQHIQSFMDSTKCCEFRNFLIIQPSRQPQEPFGQQKKPESPPKLALREDGKVHLQLEQIDGIWFKQQYELAVECGLSSDGSINLTAYFDPVVVDESRVGWLLEHFSSIIGQLESLSNNYESTIDDIIVTTQYDQEIIRSWNEYCPDASNLCMHEILERQARQTPRLQAIEAPDRNLSYQELEQLASGVAFHILEMNIPPRPIIPLCIEKSSTMVITLMAILKAGAAYIPLDPSYPSARIQYILQEVNANIVFVSRATKGRFDNITDANIVSVDDILSESCCIRLISPVLPSVSPSDAAYVLFTSGSTGDPKGVVMEHSALSTTVISQGKVFGFNQGTRVLQYTNITFDTSIVEIFTTLAHGGCLCIPSEHDRVNRLTEIMNELQVEMAFLTPTVHSLIDLKQIPSLRTLALGGECLTQENIKSAIDAGIRLINDYGPTETCVNVIVNNTITLNTSPNNIGHPRTGCAWILELDGSDRLAPLGCVGELAISGPTLARGYLNHQEQTNALFIENPSWMHHQRSRAYKTGDLARFNGDGSIQYLGRRDTQVKVHGQRIELGEIESKICQLRPGLQVAVELLAEGKRSVLIAFIVDENSSSSPTELLITSPYQEFTHHSREIVARLKDLLPVYMIPTLFIPITHLPITQSAKLDRKRLRKAFSDLSEDKIRGYYFQSNGEKLLPTTKTEETLQALWAKVLEFCDPSTIGLDDEFFELGGDSIAAIRLVAAAKREGFFLTVSDIFASPKLRQMSEVLQNERKSHDLETPRPFSLLSGPGPQNHRHDSLLDQICAESSMKKSLIQDVYPATTLQLTCLIEGQKWHRSYYSWFTLDIKGALDLERLRHACQSVANQHPILRTIFHMDGRRGLQVVLEHNTIDFQALQDKRGLDRIVLVCQDAGPPVAFSKPMVKFRVVSLDQKSHRLAIGLSHAQYDGMCINLILDDIRTAYLHQPLPTRPNYSIFIRYVLGAHNEDAKDFWRTMLHDSTMTNLVSRSINSDRHLLQSREERQISISSFKPWGVTFSTVLNAAWSLVLAHFCGKSDIVFGGLTSGRNAPIEGVEAMVGLCMNILPIRVRLDQNLRYRDLLHYLRTQQAAMIPYETMQFADIVEKCTQWPKATRFGSVVQHQNLPKPTERDDEDGELEWTMTGSISYPGMSDEVDCWVCSEPYGDNITIGLRYNDWILPSTIARKLLDSLCTTIMDIFENTDREISCTTAASRPLLPVYASITSNPIGVNKETTLNYRILSTLREAWQETLLEAVPAAERESVTHDINANFFDLGGDLITAAQLAGCCVKQQLHVSIQDVFDYPTLRLQTLLVSGKLERVFLAEREEYDMAFWVG